VETSSEQGSIFSQRIDRTAFVAFFLGAIVPLLALAFVVQRFVVPALSDPLEIVGLSAMVGSMAILSLGSYLVLRRSTHNALEQTDRDKQRLAALLESARTMTGAEHAGDIASNAVACALELSDSRSGYLLIRGKDDDLPPELFESAGADAEAQFRAMSAALMEQAECVLEGGQPAISIASGKGAAHRPATALLPLMGDGRAIGAIAVIHDESGDRYEPSQVDALNTLAALASVALNNADLRDSQRNFFSHMTEIVVGALDAHLGYNNGHGNRVAQLGNRLGRAIRLETKRLEALHFASRLHDIGMLKFDSSVQKNPVACRKHTIIGGRMLARIRLWEQLAPIVHSHHEWFDGSGYPDGLSGDAIPLEARVIAICDAFDSMTSDTSYQIAMPFETAVREIRDGAGSQFDPELVAAFLQLVEAGQITE